MAATSGVDIDISTRSAHIRLTGYSNSVYFVKDHINRVLKDIDKTVQQYEAGKTMSKQVVLALCAPWFLLPHYSNRMCTVLNGSVKSSPSMKFNV